MEASVIIPFYNAASTLARAIDSVLAQKDVTLEIILIDNNSTDNSKSIARAYVKRFEHINLYSEIKQGANYARNLGLLQAKKTWIQYLDADDELMPTKIFTQLSSPNLHSVDVICSPIIEQTFTGQTIEYQVSDMGDIWLSLLEGKIGWTCSNLWRKSALIDIGGWNTNYSSHQEKELMSRLIIEDKKFYFLNKSNCIVYEQANSISQNPSFALTGIQFMKYVRHHLSSQDDLSSNRKKAIDNQLYHKYLMAFKLNPDAAMNAMYNTSINMDLIDAPLHHRILHSVLGLKNTFKILRFLSR